jgi:hypothetical protein
MVRSVDTLYKKLKINSRFKELQTPKANDQGNLADLLYPSKEAIGENMPPSN